MRLLESPAPGQWLYGGYTTLSYAFGSPQTFTVRVYQGLDDRSLIFVAVNESPARRVVLDASTHRTQATFEVRSEFKVRLVEDAKPPPEETTQPEPTPEPLRDPSVEVILETSSTAEPVLIATVTSNHRIPSQRALVRVAAKGKWHGLYSGSALEPGVASDDFGHRPLLTWQDVVEVEVRTLADNMVRNWRCEPVEDRHAIYAHYKCWVVDEQKAASLKAVENPPLWVYIVNRRSDGIIDVHVRAGLERAGTMTVEVAGETVCGIFRTRAARALTEEGEVSDLVAGGSCIGDAVRNEDSFLSSHATVSRVKVTSSGIGLLRCERHQDSTEARSVWACATW